MQKFYQSVAVMQGEGGYAVQLDGKPVRTPAKQPLVIVSEKLAEHVAEEWRAQGERINPDAMPITRILTIARDRVPHDRALLIDDIVRYAGTDLLCYRAPSSSPSVMERWRAAPAAGGEGDLRALQELHFTPILDWAAGQGIALLVTESLSPIPQPESSLARVREMVAAAADTELAALAMATPLLGSAILALALWQRKIEAEEAIFLARLDEAHQASQWGEDAEAKAQWAKREADIRGAYHIFRILLDS
jgi:chaperone required for assembly of F1-ATPase